MNYPLISEYIESIKLAEENFDELSYLRPVLDADGQLVMSSGNFAVVFKMKDKRNGKLYAVRCFHRDQEGRNECYRLIEEGLKDVKSSYLVSFRYIDKELFVDSSQTNETEFPVLLMDWVEGVTLDKYLRENLDDQYTLKMLAYHFCQLAQWIIPQPFAHGDLKPDNILVHEDGSLVLVDYDGMFVPAMKGQNARELGSPDFRNPLRKAERFDENIDIFSLISIYISLSIIAYDNDTLTRFGSADRLLFSVKDYVDIQGSELYHYILDSFSSNGRMRKLTEVLNKLCKGNPVTSLLVQDVRNILTNDIVCQLSNDSDLPSTEEYIDAILNKTICFRTLKHLKTVIDNNRVVYVKGSNSIVIKMQDERTRNYYALKCHTGVKYNIYDRMKKVKEKLLSIQSPYFVQMQVYYDEICINDDYLIGEESLFYPVVLMDWVEGITMDAFICKSEISIEDVKRLIYNYKEMSSWLLEQNFSHGDVSPQNIIVTNDNKTILIDYDNMVFENGDVVPESVNKLKDENFFNPCLSSDKYKDNVDNFSLVSIMISLIYRHEYLGKKRNGYYYGIRFFFKKEDYIKLESSNLYKDIDQCYSLDYKLSTFLLFLKQQLRATAFSKEEINYLFKDELPKKEVPYIHPRYKGPNGQLEKIVIKFTSVYCILVFLIPFLLVPYAQLNLLCVSSCVLFSIIIYKFLLFVIASFRPDKQASLDIDDGDYIGWGCLGMVGTFLPVLFMSSFIQFTITKFLGWGWFPIPTYDEPWYITILIWIIFFINISLVASFFSEIYDYDTMKSDINNKKYQTKRKKFINRLSEDEYNYNNSNKFQDSRLCYLISVNIFVILGCLYALYCFFFLHIDLIYTNVIIVALSLGSTLLIKPLLKDKYAMYSHKTQRVYTFIVFTKMFLPMITIPFAFSGFTEFLNTTLEMSIPPYDLGWKEFLINAVLYVLIFYFPLLKADYV